MSGQTIPAGVQPPPEDRSELWAWVRSLDESQGSAEPGTAKFCKASVRHASSGGVCLVLSWRPELQERLSIEILGSPQKVPQPLLARVTHARPSSRGGWVTACAYINPPAQTDLQKAAPSVQPAPSAERP